MKLPIDPHREEFTKRLLNNQTLILRSPTGTGKTIRVPHWCRETSDNNKKTWLLEPRRIATKAAAQGLSALNALDLPGDVGYLTRFEKQMQSQTPIVVATYGILLRRLLKDPLLEDIGILILDEFHERTREMDLLLVHLRELLELRDDLKVIVMSATIEVVSLQKYLHDAVVFDIQAEHHPITIIHHKPKEIKNRAKAIQEGVASLVQRDDDDGGHILAFVESRKDAEQAKHHFKNIDAFQNWDILVCHGGVTSQAQDQLFRTSNRRRLIIATNVAESSVSIPGVTAVIDTGYHRLPAFDPKTQIESLQTRRITQFNMVQRTGRAGRFGPGRVIRLFSKAEEMQFNKMPTPHLQSEALIWPALWLSLVVSPDLECIEFLDAPHPSALKEAQTTLHIMGALNENKTPSAYGEELCRMPLVPRLAHLVIKMAEAGYKEEGALTAALLENSNGRFEGRAEDQSDFWWSVSQGRQRLQQGETLPGILGQTYKHLLKKITSPVTIPSKKKTWDKVLHEVLLSAYADRLCRNLKNDGQKASLRGQTDVFRHPEQTPIATEYFLALQCQKSIKEGREKIWVHCAHGVSAQEVDDVLAHSIPWQDQMIFDDMEDRVVRVQKRALGNLVLEQKKSYPPVSEERTKIIVTEALKRFDHLFLPNEAFKQLAGRCFLATEKFTVFESNPTEEAALKSLLPEVLNELKKLQFLKDFDWAQFLLGQMSWQHQQSLNELCPTTFETPAQTQIKINYSHIPGTSEQPILAVRIQEIFGLLETPTIGRGQIPLLIHLLGPNLRPVQTTQDLGNFWKSTYSEVRKELKRRYPKHAWPEDPYTAKPVRGGVKRRRS